MTTFIERIMSNAKESELEVALAITGVVAIATVFYSFFRTVDSSGLAAAMEEEETHKIMRKILGKLQLLAHGIEGRVQNIQHKFKQQGRNVDEKTLMWELKQFAVSEFEGTLREIQDSVLESDCDYYLSELEEACALYVKEGDKELIEIYKKIRALYRNFWGEIDDEDLCADESEGAGGGGAPTVLDTVLGVSVDTVLGLMPELTKRLLQDSDDFCAKFIDVTGMPRTHAHRKAFQTGHQALASEMQSSFLQEHEVSASEFHSVLGENADNVQIQQAIMNMQVGNARLLAKHGIIPDQG
ncbi:hypothetical protein B484DRAFT_457604 [Ochromonadaceae sp. CCMP2298]|nr:hypothetical protein B484DRAFT_457604 [Ochromonadaceae sp. CCMP2298]